MNFFFKCFFFFFLSFFFWSQNSFFLFKSYLNLKKDLITKKYLKNLRWSFLSYNFDSARNWQISFQDPATLEMLDLIQLHNQILVLLFFILLLLVGIFIESFFSNIVNSYKYKIKSLLFYEVNRFNKLENNILKRNDSIFFDEFCLLNKLQFTQQLKPSFFSNLLNFGVNWLISSFTEINKNKQNLVNPNVNSVYTKDILLEFLWSVFPLVILLLLVGPSLGLLYSSSLTKISEPFKPYMTLKIVGAMWYWNYQYPSTTNTLYDTNSFDSYLVNNLTYKSKVFDLYRNLTVDEVITLPTFKYIRLLITSQDTIHSWAVPSLAIKVDACPGRLNQVYLQVLREGFYFGQCSELCGLNHGLYIIISINLFRFIFFLT